MKKEANEETSTLVGTGCGQSGFEFQALGERKVVADFSGGTLSSDGGVLLLRQLNAGLG